MGVISYSNVTLSNINDGASLIETIVTYAISPSGTVAPSADLTDEHGLVLLDSDGEHLIDSFEWSDTIPECPAGWYLWARTVFVYSDSTRVCIYSVSRQGVNGEKGDKGDRGVAVVIVYLYQRASSAPEKPTNEITYSFSDGEITGDLGDWSATIPSGLDDIWVTFATASSSSDHDTIAPVEWAPPAKFIQNGVGISSTSIDYGVSSSGSTQPTSWSPSLPTPTKGQWLWIRTVFNYSDGRTPLTSFSKSYVGMNGYVHVAWANSADGSVDFSTVDSEGKLYIGVYTDENQTASTVYSDYSWSLIRGADGYNRATINIYKRSDTVPEKPTQSTSYTFSTGVLSLVPTGWQVNIPASDGTPCYMTSVSAVSQEDIYLIEGSYWTDPVKLVEDGYNQASVSLYKRSETAPDAPTSACTYTFATGDLSPIPTGWYTEIPPANGTPCYVTSAYAISLGGTYEFGADSWSEPVKFATDGYSQANVQLYKRASEVPSKPGVTTTYTFSTGELSPLPTGWETAIPEVNENHDPCYITTAKFAIQGDTHTIAPTDWTDPIIFGADGQDGATVSNITQQYTVYTSETQLPAPETITWVNDLPEINSEADPREWIWSRWKIETDDGGTTYTTPVCSVGMTGTAWKVDRNSNSIVGQVWQTDINTSIDQYDTNNGTTTSLRNRVTTVEQTVNGYDVVVEDVTTHHDGLVDDIANHRTELNQTADKFDLLASFNGTLTEFTLTNDMIEAITNQFVIKDSSGSSTVISGGKIKANSITLGDLASEVSEFGNTAEYYITVDGNNGIKVHDADDNTNYIRISSGSIDLVKDSVSKVYLSSDGSIRIGSTGTTSSPKRNVYITDSAVQIRNGTSVLANYSDSITLYQGNGNAAVSITTSGATFTGQINANSGYLGTSSNGFTIDSYGIYSGSKTSNTSGYITLSNGAFSRTINNNSRSDWRLAIGSKFGVTADGSLYANGANITNISASNISSGYISANRISGGSIDASDVTITNLNASNITSGTLSADYIDTSSITINTDQLYYDSNNILKIDSTGLTYKFIIPTNNTDRGIILSSKESGGSLQSYGVIGYSSAEKALGVLIGGTAFGGRTHIGYNGMTVTPNSTFSLYSSFYGQDGLVIGSTSENYERVELTKSAFLMRETGSYSTTSIYIGSDGSIECGSLKVNGVSITTNGHSTTSTVSSGSSALITSGGVYNAISSIGTFSSNTTFTQLKASSSAISYTKGASVTLAAGTYVIMGHWNFATTSSQSSSRWTSICLSKNGSDAVSGSIVFGNLAYGSMLDVLYIDTFTSSTTYYVMAATNIADVASASNWIRAVRIK